MRTALLAAVLALGTSTQATAQEPLEAIEVIGTMPLGGGRDADEIPAYIQSASAARLREQGALDLADFLRRQFSGVFVNEAQGNPLQPDVSYRGFVGSPLLGLPQGLAVYQDGVRINEPFGDTVNWALVPEAAIDAVYLMPGSNPLFGLNALGGALAIETKNGFANAGTRAEVTAGSFGRVGVQAETGSSVGERFGYFVTGAYLEEDGWRAHSPTRAAQVFTSLAGRWSRTSLDASVTYVDTDLVGNGAAPIELLEIDRKAIFTRPDQTRNELALLSLTANHEVGSRLTLAGNLYARSSDVATFNGDDSDFEECDDLPGLMCQEADEDEERLVLDRDGQPIAASDRLEGATVNRTDTQQDSLGLSLQATWSSAVAGRGNELTGGVAYDSSDVRFHASTELGALDATRRAVPGGVFVGDAFTALDSEVTNLGLYVSNALSATDALTITLSGRYNRTRVVLDDRLGTALDGDHEFSRFNPALGLTYALRGALTVYASYSESSRAPSPVELTCADEDAPCRLPNAFVADPPLEQVVARTFEAGLRGRWREGHWHAGAFRAANEDDILFISAGPLTNQGYFANVGKTRRQGVELAAGRSGEALSWHASYTALDATFRSAFTVTSPNNPGAIDGELTVRAGDRLPLIPRQLLKAGVVLSPADRLTIGIDVLASSAQHFRGDEANVAARVPGYAVVNLRARYRIGSRTQVSVHVDNVLDRDYETFGTFGEADEVLGEAFQDPRFVGPAPPRGAWVGVLVEL